MGKVRITTIGDETLEKKQKEKTEKRKETKSAVAKDMADKETKKEKIISNVSNLSTVDKQKRKETKVKRESSTYQRSKKYKTTAQLVDKQKTYSLSDAVELLSKLHLAKFDETVELHINTHETGVNGTVTLPHGTGKKFRVAIISPAKDAQAADELLRQIESGTINFDVLIATPDAMPKLAKVARILGPRGLMPNPKNGTITTKPEEIARKYEAGQVTFKTEAKNPIIHLSVGKLSFGKEKLEENITTALLAVQTNHIKNITLKSTMSPGIKIQVQ